MHCPSQSSRFNHPDYIRWTVQTLKFLTIIIIIISSSSSSGSSSSSIIKLTL